MILCIALHIITGVVFVFIILPRSPIATTTDTNMDVPRTVLSVCVLFALNRMALAVNGYQTPRYALIGVALHRFWHSLVVCGAVAVDERVVGISVILPACNALIDGLTFAVLQFLRSLGGSMACRYPRTIALNALCPITGVIIEESVGSAHQSIGGGQVQLLVHGVCGWFSDMLILTPFSPFASSIMFALGLMLAFILWRLPDSRVSAHIFDVQLLNEALACTLALSVALGWCTGNLYAAYHSTPDASLIAFMWFGIGVPLSLVCLPTDKGVCGNSSSDAAKLFVTCATCAFGPASLIVPWIMFAKLSRSWISFLSLLAALLPQTIVLGSVCVGVICGLFARDPRSMFCIIILFGAVGTIIMAIVRAAS